MFPMFWLYVGLLILAIAAYQPELIDLVNRYIELQLTRLWLFLRLYPRLQFDRLRLSFLLWRHKHNNRDTKQP